MTKRIISRATLEYLLHALAAGNLWLDERSRLNQTDSFFSARGAGYYAFNVSAKAIGQGHRASIESPINSPFLCEVSPDVLDDALCALFELDNVLYQLARATDADDNEWNDGGSGHTAWTKVRTGIPVAQTALVARLTTPLLPIAAAVIAWLEGIIQVMNSAHDYEHVTDLDTIACRDCELVTTAHSILDMYRHLGEGSNFATPSIEEMQALLDRWISIYQNEHDHAASLVEQPDGQEVCSMCDSIEAARLLAHRLAHEPEPTFCKRCNGIVTEPRTSVFSIGMELCLHCSNDEALTPSSREFQDQLKTPSPGMTTPMCAPFTARDASLVQALLDARRRDTSHQPYPEPTTDRVEIARRVFYENVHYARLNAYVHWMLGYLWDGQWHLANSMSLQEVIDAITSLSDEDLSVLLPS